MMDELARAVVAGASPEVIERTPLPAEYLAAHLRIEDVGLFSGEDDKDVRKSIRVGPVPMPELAPDEVLIAVMASALNYNTIWSATFEPLPSFNFLQYYGCLLYTDRARTPPAWSCGPAPACAT